MLKTTPRIQELKKALSERILILDGAMGTMLQKFQFTEQEFRGEQLKDHPRNLSGNNDVLCLTQPDAVKSVHTQYLEAGADIIETNTFNANAVSQAEYGLDAYVYELARAGARAAREAADYYTELTPGKMRFVAGSIGPTGKTLSMSPSVEDPAYRDIDFNTLVSTYKTAVEGLLDGGADILLLETIFDTLNAKAAIYAISETGEERGVEIPVMISGTISDSSGRLLAGQNVEAFLITVSHTPNLLSVGFNCALGAEQMRPYLLALQANSPFLTSVHPNAGLPDELGRYSQAPEDMANILRNFADEGLLNIAGGCCGTSPAHIRAIAEALKGATPRVPVRSAGNLQLAGLDPQTANPALPFFHVGERTNVAGSRKFLRLIKEGNHAEALHIARSQVESGAAIIDINMDDALLDAPAEMRKFLLLIASEPEIARVPVMIDSSSWKTIRAGLECVQGKPVINSISLKEGEAAFLAHASEARKFGAALLCMAFDENGQADTRERRIEVCRRMHDLLVNQLNYPEEDIIFDCNVFAVATGMPEHDACALDFIESVRTLKQDFPLCHFSGGISNVSFSFRGNDVIRGALHCVFLYHGMKAGLDMAIVNPAQLSRYDELDKELREAAEAVILNTSPEAGQKLLAMASGPVQTSADTPANAEPEWRKGALESRIQYALVRGDDSFLGTDMEEALKTYSDPVAVIEGPLMAGMEEVGKRFGEGKMFLPQVVKTARVMKNAVDILMPSIQAGGSRKTGRTVILATVKGDVHDIGKNIISVMLQCNGFRVVDLGVMVPCETILEAAEREKADIIALSGLITPSLEEMRTVAKEMEHRGMNIPLMIGGAAASKLYTALKLQPCRTGAPVIYTSDASQCVPAAAALTDPAKSGEFIERTLKEYAELARLSEGHRAKQQEAEKFELCSDEAAKKPYPRPQAVRMPSVLGVHPLEADPAEVAKYINWDGMLYAWSTRKGEAGEELLTDAQKMLEDLLRYRSFNLKCVYGIFPAGHKKDNILIYSDETRETQACVLPMMRTRTPEGMPESLADFIADQHDHIGMYVLSAGLGISALAERYRAIGNDYSALMLQILAGCMAEAFSEYLHREIRTKIWGYAPDEKLSMEELLNGDYQGIRPTIGYPICPDHTLKRDIFNLLDAERHTGVTLTENMALDPAASVCGLLVAAPGSFYYTTGRITEEQLADYAKRRGKKVDELRKFIAN